MTREEVFDRVTEVFKDVFDDDSITLTDETTANDIEGWDSLEHVSLMMSIGPEFGIKIPINKVASLENVGQMVDFILETVG